MGVTMENRIAVLSLSGTLPIFGLATATDNSLHVLEVVNLPNGVEELKKFLSECEKRLSSNGVMLFIDDPSGLLNDYGHRVALAGKDDATGEQILGKSMSRYLALSSANAISLPEGAHGFDIPNNAYNIRIRDDGQQYFNVDWPVLKDQALLLLLMIHCGYSQTVLQASFTNQMFAELDKLNESQSESSDPLERMINAIGDYKP